MMPAVIRQAQDWLNQDPDPRTRVELSELIEAATADGESTAAAALAELHDRFDTRLGFGTAGLRGRLGAGSNRMNRVLVAQAAAGLAAYLNEHTTAGERPTVVIGYDGRRNSDVFARDSAEIFAGLGLRAVLMPRMLPTPALAFAVRHLGADAGVMVTASHNPPEDNGYKVYLGGVDRGSQIVPPADSEIAAQIARVAAQQRVPDLPRSTGYDTAEESVIDAYVHATAAAAPAPRGADGVTWVYTAMHGVGWDTFTRVLQAAGYPPPVPVTAQLTPDAAFPTVAFPNPEEPGAMDLAYQTATAVHADLVIAHDPDADRLAVAVPGGQGRWRSLSGNEVGLLLGLRAARSEAARTTAGATLACSLMSSPGLAAIAERYGLGFATTLTGFKWISRTSGLIFGFEEALGYLVNPATVRDKDGISAALAVLELALNAGQGGRSLIDLIDEFEATFGVFVSAQVSARSTSEAITSFMASLRATVPQTVGGIRVDRHEDLRTGIENLPPGDVLRWWLEDGSRVIIRPSGTEPKLKVYLDVRAETRDGARARLQILERSVRDLLDSHLGP